jgi:hypothetical protein
LVLTREPPPLVGRWIHSREEDAGSLRTYRPSGWQLPLTRLPRHALALEADGRVVSRSAGPADARTAREGRWVIEPGTSVVLRFDWRDGAPPARIEVITCVKELLQVSVVSGSIE